VDLHQPIGAGGFSKQVEPLVVAPGGITSNAGTTLARLGLSIGVFQLRPAATPGDRSLKSIYRSEGIDDSLLLVHPSGATSTTVVTIDPSGERSFLHCVGAPKLMTANSSSITCTSSVEASGLCWATTA